MDSSIILGMSVVCLGFTPASSSPLFAIVLFLDCYISEFLGYPHFLYVRIASAKGTGSFIFGSASVPLTPNSFFVMVFGPNVSTDVANCKMEKLCIPLKG